jgi:hypothetical protein
MLDKTKPLGNEGIEGATKLWTRAKKRAWAAALMDRAVVSGVAAVAGGEREREGGVAAAAGRVKPSASLQRA